MPLSVWAAVMGRAGELRIRYTAAAIVLAHAPLALARRELLLRLGQLVLARRDDGVPLHKLGRAALEKPFVLGEKDTGRKY
mgnify:CR=1 FL=1